MSNSSNIDPKIKSLVQKMHEAMNDALSDHPGFVKSIENILAAGVKPELYMVVELSTIEGRDTGVREIEPMATVPKMAKKDIKKYDDKFLKDFRIKM